MSRVKIMHAEIRMLKYTCSVNDNIKQASSLKNFIRVRVLFYAYSKIRVFGKSRLIVIVIPITFFKTIIEKRTPFKRCNTKSIEQTSKITQALLKADKKITNCILMLQLCCPFPYYIFVQQIASGRRQRRDL